MTFLFWKPQFIGLLARTLIGKSSRRTGRNNRTSLPDASSLAVRLRFWLAALLALMVGLAFSAEEFSPAERALFMTDHLGAVRTPATLQYTFRRRGTLEESFDDKVTVALTAAGNARCCTATTEFLGGVRRVKLPEIESPTGNPVILHFLERDIHEMQRLTKGQPNYFRKRIRMAVSEGAKISDLQVPFGGATLAAKQIEISPYAADPLRPRYEKFADKQYVFVLSDAVPGGVYAIRTRVNGEPSAAGASPLLLDEMTLDDSLAAPRANSGTPKR